MGKKEKITYIDDGRTIADMSGVPDHRPEKRHPATPHPKFKDVWNTYWNAVKMMIKSASMRPVLPFSIR